jgi:DNA-binding NarL/FixJ family response regulator
MTTTLVPHHPTTASTRPRWSEREVAVLRLLAQGMSTREVARTLCWSERTIKGVVYDLTTRHGLRNRTHAVAVAVRTGVV